MKITCSHVWFGPAAMAVIDAKLVPVLIKKLQTELDEIKVI